jgi:hypothetical protein
MNRLSNDATLVSVKMGKEYLAGVLVNILAAEAGGLDPEKLRIRIGVTGQGSRPNYRIESSQLEGIDEFTFNLPSGGSDHVKLPRSALHKIFRGANHSEMVELDDLGSHERSWSTDTVSGSQIKLVLGSYN